MSGGERKLLGRWGEALAAQDLRDRGWKVLAAGWQCRHGEIDLIAQNKNFICFVEVKLRSSAKVAKPREFVDGHKQNRIRTSALLYLAEHPTDRQPRFDVVEIYAPQGLQTPKPDIVWIENAFE